MADENPIDDFLGDEEPAEDMADDPIVEDEEDLGDEDLGEESIESIETIGIGAETKPDRREDVEIILVTRPEDWQTSDWLSSFEQTEAVGLRATQIEKFGSSVALVSTKGLTDALSIAKREFMAGLNPNVVRRRTGRMVHPVTGRLCVRVEERRVSELGAAFSYDDVSLPEEQ